MNFLIPFPFLLPLIAIVFLAIVYKLKSSWLKGTATLFSFLYVVVAFLLAFHSYSMGTVVYHFADWGFPAAISYVLDPLSATMLVLCALSSLLAHCFGVFEKRKQNFLSHWILFHGMHAGINGAFLTGDFFNLFVSFEIFLILSYCLVLSCVPKFKGVSKYIYLNIVASAFLLLADGLCYGVFGTLNMGELSSILAGPLTDFQVVAAKVLFFLFLLVALMKAGSFPFFQWMPEVYAVLPRAMCAFFSALLTKVGIYLILRCGLSVFPGFAHHFFPVLIVLGLLSLFVGVLAALGQKEVKKLLAYHTVSQIGYILCGLGVVFYLIPQNNIPLLSLSIVAVVFYVIHHSFVKSSLFAIGSEIVSLRGHAKVGKTFGLYFQEKSLALLFLFSAFALAGLPPSSGFVAKFLLLKSMAQSEFYFLIFSLIVGGILTLASMLKIWTYVMSGVDEEFVRPKDYQYSKKSLFFYVLVSWILVFSLLPLSKWGEHLSGQLANPKIYRSSFKTGVTNFKERVQEK